MKKLFFLASFLWVVIIGVNAQVRFYARQGERSVCMIAFEGNTGHFCTQSQSHSTVRSNLLKNKNFYDSYTITDNKNNGCLYNPYSELSTSTMKVYRRKWKEGYMTTENGPGMWVYGSYIPGPPQPVTRYTDKGWEYIAVKNNGSVIITWKEKNNNYNGEILYKQYYEEIPISELLPQKVDYDFLK